MIRGNAIAHAEYVLAIDPGTAGKGCAWAVLHTEDGLCWAGFESADPVPIHPGIVVVERPEFQGARSMNARVKDLMDLCWNGARWAYWVAGEASAQVIERTPRDWKGSVPKPITHAKLWAVLNDDERELLGGAHTRAQIDKACEKGALKRWSIPGAACYPKSFTMHNILDAVALGAVELGRLKLV